jgi:hypothetical protein
MKCVVVFFIIIFCVCDKLTSDIFLFLFNYPLFQLINVPGDIYFIFINLVFIAKT